ncbi:MAG: DUF1648 domain-containing protein [Trebonia sp.]
MSDGAVSNGAGGISGLSGPDAAGVSGGPRRDWIVALVCGVLPAALLAATVAVPAALWSRLPARIADHWTLDGTANATAPRLLPFLLVGAIAIAGVGVVCLGWASARPGARVGLLLTGRPAGAPVTRGTAGRRGRTAQDAAAGIVATGLFMMAVSAGSVIMVTTANLSGGTERSASVGPGVLPGLLGGPLLLAAAAGYLLRRYGGLGAADGGAPPSTLGLRAGERAVWTGRARARRARPSALLLVAAGVLLGVLTAQWPITVVVLVAGVFLLGFTSVRVTVAARGVTVGYGLLGLRLTRIPLRKIASAGAVERSGFSFGYRGSLLVYGTAAVVIRRGAALRLTLRDGKTFLVTVDDAATGAALLNDLITGAASTGA